MPPRIGPGAHPELRLQMKAGTKNAPHPVRSPLTPRKPASETIPGYRLIEPLGKGGFGEGLYCHAPGGLIKAIKFVHSSSGAPLDGRSPSSDELRAIERIKDL